MLYKKKTTIGWPCLEEPKSTARCRLAVIEQNPVRKRWLRRPRRCEEVIKNDVLQMGSYSNWGYVAVDKEE